MKILILGGTQFVGRHIALAFLSAGHDVTVLTRGKSPDPLPPSVERLRGDRNAPDGGTNALGPDRTWDACVDVSGYTPRQVGASAARLRGRVGRYVFISAVSVYGPFPPTRPVAEDCPVLPPCPDDVAFDDIDDATYGPLKVACENVVGDIFGERAATIIRPQVVVGPFDTSGRYSYWLDLAARPGPTPVPGDGTDHVQVIDARDLARFVVRAVEQGIGGTFNMAGPRLTWAQFARVLGITDPIWVIAEDAPPLYRPENGPRAALMDIDTTRARAAGLILTDPADTLRDARRPNMTPPPAPPLRGKECPVVGDISVEGHPHRTGLRG